MLDVIDSAGELPATEAGVNGMTGLVFGSFFAGATGGARNFGPVAYGFEIPIFLGFFFSSLGS